MNLKNLITTGAFAFSLCLLPQVSLADCSHGKGHGFFKELFKDKNLKEMSPEERKAFKKERKEKWAAMSKEEKLAHIEERRKERLKNMDETFGSMADEDKVKFFNEKFSKKRNYMEEKWQNMNDDEKIEFVENKMSHKKHKGKHHKKCDK